MFSVYILSSTAKLRLYNSQSTFSLCKQSLIFSSLYSPLSSSWSLKRFENFSPQVHVLLVKKGGFGLKYAPRLWRKRLDKILREFPQLQKRKSSFPSFFVYHELFGKKFRERAKTRKNWGFKISQKMARFSNKRYQLK